MMSEDRQKINVEVRGLTRSDMQGVPLVDLIAKLHVIYEEIPAEFRNEATCNLNFDDYGAEIDFEFWRPETDEEVRERAHLAERAIAAQNLRDELEYERLSKKFGAK